MPVSIRHWDPWTSARFPNKVGFCFRLAAIAAVLLLWAQVGRAAPLRYTLQSSPFYVVIGNLLPNCATHACVITITGVGDSASVTAFPTVCPTCGYKGQGTAGFWNRTLTGVSVTVYDPISNVTVGPATFPSGFYVSFDSFNGGIGFGSDGYGGPAYPESIVFVGGPSPYQYWEIPSSYALNTPVIAGGENDNCPAAGLPCLNTPLPTIPVTLPDGTTVPFSVPVRDTTIGQFWVQEEPPTIGWSAAAPMLVPGFAENATVLNDGRVLVAGGTSSLSAEIYDPVADSWTLTAPPLCFIGGQSATLLADGRVLALGGGGDCPQGAVIFDPVTQAWSKTANSPVTFSGYMVVLRLQDGRVLVVFPSGSEVYDPIADTWTATNGTITVTNPIGVMLPSGLAVVMDAGLACPSFTPEIFNPATNAWAAGTSVSGCFLSTPSATALTNGSVLVTSGSTWTIYNPVSNAWTSRPGASAADLYTLPLGEGTVAQSMSDGRILLVGGKSALPPSLTSIQLAAPISPLFDPATDGWIPKPALSAGRIQHAVVRLQNGDLLAIGGRSIGTPSVALASVERLDVVKRAQSVTTTYPFPPYVAVGGTATLPMMASSGLPVTISSQGPECSVSGDVVTGLAVGTCPIVGNQAGNVSYLPAAPSPVNLAIFPSAPVFGLSGGTYHTAQSLTLTDATPGATIVYTYTPGGVSPTATTPTAYSGPISINSTGIVEAIASVITVSPPSHYNSKVSSKAYVYVPQSPAAVPAFSLAGGTYHAPQMLVLTDATPGATIYYTTNGTTPTALSMVYAGPITIAATELVEAAATAPGFTLSPVSAKAYTYVPFTTATAPAFSLAGGTYTTPQTLTLTDATPGAVIHYTTNGTTPTAGSAVYTAPITIASTELVQAIAIASGYNPSPVSAKGYTYSALPLAIAPSFSLAGGHYTTPQMLTLKDSTPGAVIHYTTNGTTPNASSAVYSGPITVSTTELVEAIAVATGYSTSNVSSKSYTIP